MAENSKIEWTHHTFNPWIGCTKVSDGCKNCYAETQMDHRYGKAKWGPKGTRVVTAPDYWKQPLKWNREAIAAGERRRVFCASLADVFEDWQGPMTTAMKDFAGSPWMWSEGRGLHLQGFIARNDDPTAREATMGDWRNELFATIEATPGLDWLLLTKRPENIMAMVPASWVNGFPRNVWVGTSVENQKTAHERIPHLLKVPAVVRFLSCEPLLADVDITEWLWGKQQECPDCPRDADCPCGWLTACENGEAHLGWIIIGGESGPDCRPTVIGHLRAMAKQGIDAKVPVFVKQLGVKPTNREGEPHPIADHHNIAEFPEDLRVRQFPEVAHV